MSCSDCRSLSTANAELDDVEVFDEEEPVADEAARPVEELELFDELAEGEAALVVPPPDTVSPTSLDKDTIVPFCGA
jgi:hypothetical protein